METSEIDLLNHLKIRPIAIFTFSSLNYSLAACLQYNSRPKSPTKVEKIKERQRETERQKKTERKLQQFTVSGWLIMNGGESSSEKRKKPLRLKLRSIHSVTTTISLCLHESLFS